MVRLTDQEVEEIGGRDRSTAGEVALAREVRRLQSLVTAAESYVVASDAWCAGCCRTVIREDHGQGCEVAAILVEARAIHADARAAREPEKEG